MNEVYSRLRMYTSDRGLECSLTTYGETKAVAGNYVFEKGLHSIPVIYLNKVLPEYSVNNDVNWIAMSLFFVTDGKPTDSEVSEKVKMLQKHMVFTLESRARAIAWTLSKSYCIFPAESHDNDYSFTEVGNEIYSERPELSN